MKAFKQVLIFLLCVSTLPCIANSDVTEKAFTKMKSLVGAWKKTGTSEENFQITFELTANNSVLVESWKYKGNMHSLTLYHQDGDDLLATHYCPQGNQPRLKMLKSGSENQVSFKYQDATNLLSLDNSHQHALSFEFTTAINSVTRRETYLSKEGKDDSVITLEKSTIK
ncbi:hypothetical protein [Pseudoalteromonas denitrificans]|uniref:Uncharacterized protein n=1 Tax=Pseudoalteromonas denitrificans DSM 6059 TaxID=1123010 RepID=A0A1I1MQT9_9GAMM|nr:hypothetical protein [Pseudoalteromonas denitrificans]SFC87545.1 hypothetical protein SAMN02745724_02774 [Pseudoalteromonas denitrificans DSM 6059]